MRKRIEQASRQLVAAALALFLLAAAATAQAPGNPPQHYAITNAKIVTVSGAVIEGGTVVVSNGLIVAVGKDAKIPAEAWVIDGKGMTVYPGFIDAYTDLGLQTGAARPPGAAGAQAPAPTPGPPGQQPQQVAPAQGPEDRRGTTPWRMAADELNTGDRRLEQWRSAGFTTAVSVPRGGFFPGQGAVINLAGARDEELVVKTPVALSIALQAGGGFGGGFPGSLMGIISYIKQIYYDAEQARAAQAVYAANPRGVARPRYDRSTATLNEALAANRPVLMPAANPHQMERMIELAEHLKLSPILYGVQRGYESAQYLAAKKVPVIVSLRWPERERDGDPEAEESLETLRFRARAPSTPAELDKAGVRFAFFSDGITTPRDILRNAKKSIDAGLKRESAVRAFTLSAAEMFGVADRLGSIEPGKIANLIVATGDIFEDQTQIKFVFVDGRKFEVREAPRPATPGAQPGGGQRPPSSDVSGRWTISVETPNGGQSSMLDLRAAADGSLSGTLNTQMGNSPVTGTISGNRVSFTVNLDVGGQAMSLTFSGTVEGDAMRGSVSSGFGSFDFTGRRGGQDAADEGGAR
jgi:imidazolonepropionase-like amidohydrolase